jgi:putative membrane-bound dehydrogenase-like protein
MKLILPLVVAGTVALAQQPIAATGADGKALNLGFESGTLDGWTATGTAFEKQPVRGDLVAKRRADMKSQHMGEFWIGGFEIHGKDAATGTLTSVAFKVTQPWASFLFAGGETEKTRVEIATKDDGKVFHKAWSRQDETMRRSVVDLRKLQGREIFVRLVDEHTGHWGHLNFDDFVFHAAEPNYPATQLAKKSEPALSLDTVEHAGLPADKAAAVAKVPEGYELRVFAAEPDIINPIAFALDDRARVWAVEGMTYPTRAKDAPDTKPGMGGKDRVLVFEDTDGDGKHDKRTVFLEGVNLVSGIEVGHGGVWLGAAPYLLFVPVADWENPKPAGDAKVMLDGWGYQDTHETLNTFRWGPDGWLYGCHGVFTHSKVGKPGTADKERVKINAGIWRYHPQRHTFEVFAEGTSNPWGMDWNEDGELFIEACVIPHLFHMIPGARYTRQAGSHFNPYTYDDIKTIADHRHYLGGNPHAGNNRSDAAGGGHAHAGLCIPQHPSWPDSIRGKVLMGNIHGSRINVDILERKGSGYVAKHGADFIHFNDKASQIIDLREGPDGTLWMIDWYDLNQCHRGERAAHDYTTGRIFVLAKKGSKAKQRDVSGGETETLLRLALEADPWMARQACRNLKERTQALTLEAIQKMWEQVFTNVQPDKAPPLFWKNIGRLGGALEKEDTMKDATLILSMFTETMPAENFAGLVRATVETKTLDPKLPGVLHDLAMTHKSPVVRLAIACASQRLTIAQRKPIVLALLAHEEDKDDHNLPLMYWYAAEPIVGDDPAWAAGAIGACKIPKVTEFISRRLAEK